MALSPSPNVESKVEMLYHALFKVVDKDEDELPLFLRFARQVTSNANKVDVAAKLLAAKHGINVVMAGALISGPIQKDGVILVLNNDLDDVKLLLVGEDEHKKMLKKHTNVQEPTANVVGDIDLQSAFDQWIQGEMVEDDEVIVGGQDFIGDADVSFVDEEIAVDFEEFVSVPDVATWFDPKMTEVMVADLAGGLFTSFVNIRILVDLLEMESKFVGTLSPCELFVEGHLSSVMPLVPCTKLVVNENHRSFLEKWQKIIDNKLTTFIERWRITMNEQFPYMRESSLANDGIHVTSFDECNAYDATQERFMRLIGSTVVFTDDKPHVVYKGDKVVVHAFLTSNTIEQVAQFNMIEHRRQLKTVTNGKEVVVVFNVPYVDSTGKLITQTTGKVNSVNDAGFDVALNVGVAEGFEYGNETIINLPYRHSKYQGYYVFLDANVVRKQDLLMKPHNVDVADLNDIEMLYPNALEAVLMEFANDDGEITFDEVSITNATERLHAKFPLLSFNLSETRVLRNLVDMRVKEEIKTPQRATSLAFGRKSGYLKDQSAVDVRTPYDATAYNPPEPKEKVFEPPIPTKIDMFMSPQAVGIFPFHATGITVVDFGFVGIPFDKGVLMDDRAYDPIFKVVVNQSDIIDLKKQRLHVLLNDIIRTRAQGTAVADDDVDGDNDPMDLQEMSEPFVYSIEYDRETKYSGDPSVTDDIVGAATEDMIDTHGDADFNMDMDGSIKTEVASFLSGLLGFANNTLILYIDIVSTLISTFGERNLRAALAKVKGNNLRSLDKPEEFWMSRDTYNLMMNVYENNETRVLTELQKIMFFYLPAVIKCLILMNELTISSANTKEQAKIVDEAFSRKYMMGWDQAKKTQALKRVNDTLKVLLQYDHMIKGMTNMSATYVKHLVAFPYESYGLNTWLTYRPYININASSSVRSERVIHNFILHIHKKLQGMKLQHMTRSGTPYVLNSVFEDRIGKRFGYHDIMNDKDVAEAIRGRKHITNTFEMAVKNIALPHTRALRVEDASTIIKFDKLTTVESRVKTSFKAASIDPFITHNTWAFPSDMRTIKDIEDKGIGAMLVAAQIDAVSTKLLIEVDKTALRVGLLSVLGSHINTLAQRTNVKDYVNVQRVDLLEDLNTSECVTVASYMLLNQLATFNGNKEFKDEVLLALNSLVSRIAFDTIMLDSSFEKMREKYNQDQYGALQALNKEDRNVYMDLINAKLVDKFIAEERQDHPEEETDMIPVARDDNEFDT